MKKNFFSEFKVALVHDWLIGMRGGEKCLEVICELFPQADLYTLVYQEGELSKIIESMNIKTSLIQKLPFGLKKYRHYLPLFPFAIEKFDFRRYDLIISSSHCCAQYKAQKNQMEFDAVSYTHLRAHET